VLEFRALCASPAGFCYARQLTQEGSFAETKTTHLKTPHKGLVATTDLATVNLAHSKLWFALRLHD
jgi:hypothetical protein